MVVRHDMELENLGKVSELLKDMTPFMPGTTGLYGGKHFTLAGRIKVLYPKGTWSEWWALFDDGSEGWLAEAQGFYMMSFLDSDPAPWNRVSDLGGLGGRVEIKGESFQIDDIKNVKYAGSEGELPFVFQRNLQGTSVDLRGPRGKFASVFFGDGSTKLYLGEYVPFEKFQFQHLRELDGWSVE
jgi:hypothetical protein